MNTLSEKDFGQALALLIRLTDREELPFSDTFTTPHSVISALKIIHKAVLEGSAEQKKQLEEMTSRIALINTLIARDLFCAHVKKRLGIFIPHREIERLQIAMPKKHLHGREKAVRILGAPFRLAFAMIRFVVSIVIDVLLMLPALGLMAYAKMASPNFNPEKLSVKQNKTPILLLHGCGFNETEWVVGRYFLKNERYGSVYSLNYDGLISNDFCKGIGDYAKGKVSEMIERIKVEANTNHIILIGHSMGGLVAGYYAEQIADKKGTVVEHVISIGTPWKGAPCLSHISKAITDQAKYYRHMSEHSLLLKSLVQAALRSERDGKRKYYSIGATTDSLVPVPYCTITEDPRRQHTVRYLGHYGLVFFPSVWRQVCFWLDGAYVEETIILLPLNSEDTTISD